PSQTAVPFDGPVHRLAHNRNRHPSFGNVNLEEEDVHESLSVRVLLPFHHLNYRKKLETVKYTDWTHQQLNDLCSQTRKHFCLLSSFSHPILGLGELLHAVHLKVCPAGLRCSFRTKAYWLLSQLVFSATRHALLSICDRAF